MKKINISLLSDQLSNLKKFNFITTSKTITFLNKNTKVFLIPVKKPEHFKLNYFIFEDEEYLVKIEKCNERTIVFEDPKSNNLLEVELDSLYQLSCEI
jgi:hypothetical protein